MNEDALHLKVVRRKAGFRQRDCAHLVGAHEATVSDFESGKTLPNLRQACALALVYGKPIEALFPDLIVETQRLVADRLSRLPDCSGRWLGRFNRQGTLNSLANRLADHSRQSI